MLTVATGARTIDVEVWLVVCYRVVVADHSISSPGLFSWTELQNKLRHTGSLCPQIIASLSWTNDLGWKIVHVQSDMKEDKNIEPAFEGCTSNVAVRDCSLSQHLAPNSVDRGGQRHGLGVAISHSRGTFQ